MTGKKEYTAAEINMMPKSARPINFDTLTDKEMINKYSGRVRRGKTAKDHKRKGPSGATNATVQTSV